MSLFAVPNVSEGRDSTVVTAIGDAFASADGVRLLDVHVDADHHRSVFWLAGGPGQLAESLVRGAREAVARVDLRTSRGIHPHVGVLDVAPLVFVDEALRGAACAEALLAAGRIGDELGLPVYLYGILAEGRTRAELRRGGLAGLIERATPPDFGPHTVDLASGAVLVGARPPLIAINFEIDGDVELAKRIAADVRTLPARPRARALARGRAASPRSHATSRTRSLTPLPILLERVRAAAPVRTAELVGLAPRSALADWPEDVAMRHRQTLEDLLE